MKVNEIGMIYDMAEVAPLVGAWIERMRKIQKFMVQIVAPLVGAWIESKMKGIGIDECDCRSSCRSVD